MKPHTRAHDSDSDSSTSLAFSSDEGDDHDQRYIHQPNSTNSQQFFAKLVRDTRSKVEQKTSEINATVQEKLPEWKQRGAIYSKEQMISSRFSHQQNENAVFGMPLEVAVALTRIDSDDMIPAIFRRCVEYLNDVGKIPGSTTTVNKLRLVFNDGSDMDFFKTRPDPHAVSTLLKMYLRELPEPIIPTELVNEYTKSIQSLVSEDKKSLEDTLNTDALPPISSEVLAAVRSITSRLPVHSFCLLQLLCRHLKQVADHASENRMSISNLAVIFLPTLNIGRALFHCMLKYYTDIFEGKGSKKSHTSIVPPPLPQKPRNLSIDHSHRTASPPPPSPPLPPPPSKKPPSKRIFHTKTMSDTDVIVRQSNSLKINPVISTKAKVPPPKPSRSPFSPVSPIKQSPELPPRPPPLSSKPRSKSISTPGQSQLSRQLDDEQEIWRQSGRVEAIGKRFETMMVHNKITK
ncbi:putative Rho-type GTPase-activating protein 2 [Choanephora cucurbitarum]|uniref:Putative Rho-type GTPase-activating protein 2 n=1 Tax=Choanephora cucurbitarum TaxID=101091 RepID=A0A1C7NQJ5_9FUNG|nr:putative Rho-type GTPase-activating protein 2 [Choanephora cucurbitarum]